MAVARDEAIQTPRENASDDEVRAILEGSGTVAVIGLSDRPHRDSHRVSAYLQSVGYRVIPVNPRIDAVLGERAYASLADVPDAVDLVDIFRRPAAVPAIVEEAIAKGVRAIWMQIGVVHNAAADRAREAGLKVVMDRCTYTEHQRLGIEPRRGEAHRGLDDSPG